MAYYPDFLGSAGGSTSPAPARLGLRFARACVRLLEADGASVELIDPRESELGAVFKPHFTYPRVLRTTRIGGARPSGIGHIRFSIYS